jgi:predicted metal-dependent hydrolase
MAIKKSELYASLWASCDELRGGMDASQYKDFVLAMLFIKYVSDRYAGVPYLMQIVEEERPATVDVRHTAMILHLRPGTEVRSRHVVLREWYRSQIKDAIPPLREKWEPIVGVSAADVTVRRMKTRWGSCSPRRRTIRINLELAKKPPECLDYILVHELVHLLEPTHNARFVDHMDKLMPEWRHRRDELNRLPVPHEDWGY